MFFFIKVKYLYIENKTSRVKVKDILYKRLLLTSPKHLVKLFEKDGFYIGSRD